MEGQVQGGDGKHSFAWHLFGIFLITLCLK
jgi:hypothetical protein